MKILKTFSSLKKKSEDTSQIELYTIKHTIVKLISNNLDDDRYILAGDIEIIFSKRYADFDVRNYGFKSGFFVLIDWLL